MQKIETKASVKIRILQQQYFRIRKNNHICIFKSESMKIDSHQHFWIFNEREYGWMGENMKVIRQDHLPADLATEQKKAGFNGSVAVQARQIPEETEWLLKLSEQNDIIKGVVGWVDLRSPDIEKQLEKYSKHPKLVGVRHVVQDESVDFILGKDFLRGISLLKKYNLTYDILVFPQHLPNTIKLVEQFPYLTFVLDHIAKPLIKDKKISPWKEDIERLAKFKNVYCKVSGMVTEADWYNWKNEDFKPYLDIVFNAFGTNRIMIGSDWPVCKVAGDYTKVLGIVTDYIKKFSAPDKAKIMGETAVTAYKLKV
jgi:L-fuconolactonase